MTSAYIAKLGLAKGINNVNVIKIDDLLLKTYEMATIRFLFQNRPKKIWLFEKTFLLANTNIKMILKIPPFFLIMQIYSLILNYLTRGCILL